MSCIVRLYAPASSLTRCLQVIKTCLQPKRSVHYLMKQHFMPRSLPSMESLEECWAPLVEGRGVERGDTLCVFLDSWHSSSSTDWFADQSGTLFGWRTDLSPRWGRETIPSVFANRGRSGDTEPVDTRTVKSPLRVIVIYLKQVTVMTFWNTMVSLKFYPNISTWRFAFQFQWVKADIEHFCCSSQYQANSYASPPPLL